MILSILVTVTMYCLSGTTASGTHTQHGIVAVSPDLHHRLPFGTKVRIDGKTYVVRDRTSSTRRNTIDIYTPKRSTAVQFGKQQKRVEIVK